MKLTSQQIQELYKFTRQHYVEHFDVQTELVDHLANDIEQIWRIQPNLSFEQARAISFKKFGVFGFMDVVSARQKAMNKKYWKILWRFTKEWFQLPKLILTTTLVLFFYTICRLTFAKYYLLGILVMICVYALYKGIYLKRELNYNLKQTGRKWMLEEMIFNTGIGSFALLPINFTNILNLTNFENAIIDAEWVAILYAVIFTLITIIIYITVEVLPKKAKELLTENYPEYNLV
ncbi:hypothetical protein [Lutibacter sp.]